MKKVYIVGAKRTALGSFGGSLMTVPACELGATAISAALAQSKVRPENIDEVIVGNVLAAGQGMGPGRQAAAKAGIPHEVPALTLNMICGSGMKAVIDGVLKIKSGEMDLVVAAGMENMSQAPYLIDSRARFGMKMGAQQMSDSLISDGLTDAFHRYHMGVTAENIAKKYHFSREAQDVFALKSQQKAVQAVEQGRFDDEIAPVTVLSRKGEAKFTRDEYPRKDASLEQLAKLKPAFDKQGTVTAGNASGINDGGVALVLASGEALEKWQLEPLAEVIACGQGGVDPALMGLGPVPAIGNALKRANMNLRDIDLLEINEAFAAQAMGVARELCAEHQVDESWFENRTNVNGGAIALGHPLGASGGRIIVSLLYEMIKQNKNTGLASLCIGGGMGTAIILKLTK
ncbi:acetyl-CoA C-acetyltransferase [Klebsiella pneumoniae]|uniref:acetyl-CoA C-acetyltransferase n=1 Tax=Klebsiella pneumoniae TaxID=573 RepID=UPI001143F51B|nr:acetyl-CoA C-acetyltransferase [Klebsiella pneumoniae]MCB3583514.1 acetyl-CoA C-acetyltransferase [Klebsiella pneumoniae]MCB3611120.1 acetyl-CoA C-acetyltransferase [Klebsiella pneumoniae]MCG5606598.1 acetyl-CoA C-acetyltransferase [Klebsiella pneumoniae]NGE19300.1 acetyl-CoA C-acetyltransferase [Klebsiella pneumoniae]TYX16202.1 acetyl-CoA C-acetyltransferase [Klebsiella pneumoniae]